jgi:hypothetical protein
VKIKNIVLERGIKWEYNNPQFEDRTWIISGQFVLTIMYLLVRILTDPNGFSVFSKGSLW